MMEKKRALKLLGISIAGMMAALALVVWIADPFYQYHAPWGNKEPVLYDRDHQVVGTIRTLSYDSVLLGSSVAENFNTDFLEQQYGGEILKIIRASGSAADLLYYLKLAHEQQELKNVFWCMDIFALTGSTQVTLYEEGVPRYLHTETILDDYTYLFNKDILFMKLPLSIAYGMLGKNIGGRAYDWSEDKQFGTEQAMRAYKKPVQNAEYEMTEEEKELIQANIDMVIKEIDKHPQIEYTVLFPPYSMLWWDSGYVNGISEKYFYVLEQVLPRLTKQKNVRVHFFMAEDEIVCNLDYYMDMLHYSPAINQYMLEELKKDTYHITENMVETTMEQMKGLHDRIVQEEIYQYYP